MTDVSTGSAGGEAIPAHVAGGDGPLTPRDAMRSLVDWRNKQDAAAAQAPEPAAATEESAPAQVEADAAPPQEVPGETQEAEPAPEPPIEPPRSWTKAEQEEFATYPREAQEKIARREQERETAVRRSQNEAAEKLKGLTAKEQAVEQARQQYESALPIMLNELQGVMAGEFADIKTMADVQKMANEDWPRYVRWDAQQKQVAAVQQQITIAQQRQIQERQTKFADFAKSETEKLLEQVPELRDEKKRVELTSAVISTLKDIGFSDEELNALGNGDKELSIYDHRLRLMALESYKYREAQKQQKTVVAKKLPPVQKPGVTQGRNASIDAEIQTLSKQLDNASGRNAILIAQRLTEAKRRAAR